jgi:hypothetical protein
LFVAAADFQDQINSGLSVSGIHAIKFMTVLVSIMLAYKDGFSYQFTLDDEHMRAGKSGLFSLLFDSSPNFLSFVAYETFFFFHFLVYLFQLCHLQ